jgi:HSP20 family protein
LSLKIINFWNGIAIVIIEMKTKSMFNLKFITNMYCVPKKQMSYGNSYPTFNHFFNDFFREETLATKGATVPAVNVRENAENFTLEVAAPGMAKEDFKIEVNQNILKIWSDKKQETSQEAPKENTEQKPLYTRQEFNYQAFQRSFKLPATVNGDNISAKYNNGILEVIIPKKEEATFKKTVEIL